MLVSTSVDQKVILVTVQLKNKCSYIKFYFPSLGHIQIDSEVLLLVSYQLKLTLRHVNIDSEVGGIDLFEIHYKNVLAFKFCLGSRHHSVHESRRH